MRWPLLFGCLAIAACNDCPKGQQKLYESGGMDKYHCIDPDAEARRQVAEDEAKQAARRQREAEEYRARQAQEHQYDGIDAAISTKHRHNWECNHGKGCDLEPLTADEARRAPQWRARERLKLRPKQMRGEALTDYEQDLLKD